MLKLLMHNIIINNVGNKVIIFRIHLLTSNFSFKYKFKNSPKISIFFLQSENSAFDYEIQFL